MRTELIVTSLAVLLTIPAAAQTATPAQKSPAKTAKVNPSHARSAPGAAAIHKSAIVIDTHADTPGRFVDESFDPSTDAGKGHWDLARAKSGNLGAEFFSIWVDPVQYKDHYTRRALDMIDSVHEAARNHPHELVMAYSAEDIVAARKGPHQAHCRADRGRGRPRHRGRHSRTARFLSPRRPLHDA